MSDLKRKYEEYKRWIKLAGTSLGVAGLVYLGYKAYTYDPVSYLSDPSKLRESYDFIVIGAGTSGSVVARRLCEHKSNPSVLLIESGPPDDATLFSTQVIPCMVQLNQVTDIDYQFYTTSQKHSCYEMKNNQSFWPRGKIMGGSSILNYGVWVRGDKRDYDSWCNDYGCNGWSYNDILPFYKKCENINLNDGVFNGLQSKYNINEWRGLNGPLSISHRKPLTKMSQLFVQAAESVGYKINDDYNGSNNGDCTGASHTQYSMKNGARHSSFRAYIAPLFDSNSDVFSKRPNIDILPYSHVSKIITQQFNGNNPNNTNTANGGAGKSGTGHPNGANIIATGIEFYFKDDKKKKYTINCNYNNGGEVIVCGGAVSSPQLLLLSGIGPKEELEELKIDCVADVPGMGKNLTDHIMLAIRMNIPKNIPLLSESNVLSISALYNYVFKGEGWWTTGGLDAQVFTHSGVQEKYGINGKFPDLQLVCCNVAEPDMSKVQMDKFHNYKLSYPEPREMNATILERQHSALGLVMFLHPTSNGSITLKNNNVFEHPNINPNYLESEYDIEAIVKGCEKLTKIFESKLFKDLGCKIVRVIEEEKKLDTPEGRREVYEIISRKFGLTIYHPVGTCKMGNIKKDNMAVVDTQLKVKNTINIRVIDASIMPHLISGNTQAPCYMIGEKGAYHVLEAWETRNVK